MLLKHQMLLKHLNRILYLENWEHTETNWEESRLHYRCAKFLTWTYICVLLPIRSNTQAWFPCDHHILSHQRTGECVQTQMGMDTASVLVKVLSLALSCILGLTWPDYSVFGSSQDFAGFSSSILRPFAFSQVTTVTSMFLSCTCYHCGIHVHSQQYQTHPWEPDSRWGLKARTPGLICDSLSFALPSQNCDFSLLTSPQRQFPKRTCLGCKTWRSVTSFWPSSPSGPLFPPASVSLCSFPGCCYGSLDFSAPNAPVSSRILGPCSHLPRKSDFYHPCRFWWGGLSSLGIDDSFLYSCFLDLLWKDLSSSTASVQETKRSLLNMQTLQPALQPPSLRRALFHA